MQHELNSSFFRFSFSSLLLPLTLFTDYSFYSHNNSPLLLLFFYFYTFITKTFTHALQTFTCFTNIHMLYKHYLYTNTTTKFITTIATATTAFFVSSVFNSDLSSWQVGKVTNMHNSKYNVKTLYMLTNKLKHGYGHILKYK